MEHQCDTIGLNLLKALSVLDHLALRRAEPRPSIFSRPWEDVDYFYCGDVLIRPHLKASKPNNTLSRGDYSFICIIQGTLSPYLIRKSIHSNLICLPSWKPDLVWNLPGRLMLLGPVAGSTHGHVGFGR